MIQPAVDGRSLPAASLLQLALNHQNVFLHHLCLLSFSLCFQLQHTLKKPRTKKHNLLILVNIRKISDGVCTCFSCYFSALHVCEAGWKEGGREGEKEGGSACVTPIKELTLAESSATQFHLFDKASFGVI